MAALPEGRGEGAAAVVDVDVDVEPGPTAGATPVAHEKTVNAAITIALMRDEASTIPFRTFAL
jgi:hypothetical protein